MTKRANVTACLTLVLAVSPVILAAEASESGETVGAPSVESQVTQLVATVAHLKPEDIRATQTLAQLGVDSLGVLRLILSLDKQFQISISKTVIDVKPGRDNKAVLALTIADLTRIVQDCQAQPTTRP